MEQAADWYALLRSGEANAHDHAAWRLWLEGASEHQQAWHYVERIGMRFAQLQASSERDAAVAAYRRVASRSGRTRRQVVLGLLGAVGAAGLGWASWRHTPLPALVAGWGADHRAGVGETRQITLSDGTRIWLRALSAFDVDYGASLRRLQLVEGEMLIDTAPDAARPFVVDTGSGRLQALGTRFTVRQEQDAVLVAVFDGAVKVAPARGAAVGVVSAGEQAYFSEGGLRPVAAASPGHEAWTRGVLVADGLTLGEVVGELRRYHLGHLGVAPEIAHLRVFGSFPIDDVPRALAMLASVMPIRVRQPLGFWISVEARA